MTKITLLIAQFLNYSFFVISTLFSFKGVAQIVALRRGYLGFVSILNSIQYSVSFLFNSKTLKNNTI